MSIVFFQIRFDRIDAFTQYGPPGRVAYVVFNYAANAKRFVMQAKKFIRCLIEGQSVDNDEFESLRKLEQCFMNGMIVEHLFRPTWLPADKSRRSKRPAQQRARSDVPMQVPVFAPSPMQYYAQPPMIMPMGGMPMMMTVPGPQGYAPQGYPAPGYPPQGYQQYPRRPPQQGGFRPPHHNQQPRGQMHMMPPRQAAYGGVPQYAPGPQQPVMQQIQPPSYDQRPDYLSYLKDKAQLNAKEARYRLGYVEC